MIQLLGGTDPACALSESQAAWAESGLNPAWAEAGLNPAWAGSQGCSDAGQQHFCRADGAQLLCLCVSITVRVPCTWLQFPCVEVQSTHFSLGLRLEA